MAASTGSGDYDVVVQAYDANTFATISSGDTVTLTDNVTNCNFFKIEAGATLVGGGFSITVDNDSSNHSFVNIGTISGVLDVIITNPNGQSNFDGNGQGGNVRNLTVNNAGAVVTLTNDDQTLDGNLVITAGQLTTSDGSTDRNLTVAGTTTIGPNSGAADQATLTCNSSTISLGSGITSSAYGLYVNQGGTFTGGSGTHTLGSVVVRNNAAAKCTLTSGVTTIDGEHGGENYAINVEGSAPTFAHGSGTVTITRASDTRIRNAGADLALNNLIINHASADITLASNGLTCAGNLTITAGKLGTGANKSLTVGTNTDDNGATGHLLILDDGELNCNSSTVIVGSVYCQIAAGSNGTGFSELNLPDSSGSFTVRGPEKTGYVFRLDNQAECNHNGGTLTFSLTAENHPSIMDVTSLRGTGVNNILVTQTVSSASSGGVLEFVGSDTVKGNLTLTGNGSESCLVDTNFNGASLTIEGDVTVNNHSTFIRRTTNTGNYSFKSLTINSGGTFNATQGTTTITGETSTGNAINIDGTFVHNKGTVKIDHDTTTNLDILGTSGVDLYNLIVDSDGTVNYNTSVIENNLTKLGSGLMRPTGDSGRNLTVKGTLLLQAGSFGRGPNDTHTNTFGNIVVEGGELILTGGGGSGKTIVNGSFRNVGGTVTSH